MHLNTFLQAFNRLGLTHWEGIEEDIAWGHVTSLMGLARPSIDGPIFIYRVQCRLGGQSSTRVQLMATTGLGPEPLLAAIASHFTDLVDPAQCEPWRLISIDTSRGRSRNRELHYPCYMLVDFCAFRSFGLRPHGVIEVVLGQEEFSFPTVLPITVNVVLLGEFLAPLLLTGLPGLQWQAWINGELLGFWLPWWLCFLGSTSYCLIAIVCRLLCLKLKTCGRRLSWRDIQRIQKVAFQRRTHCGLSHDFAQIHGWCTHSIVSAALGGARRFCGY